MTARVDDLKALRELLWDSIRQTDPDKRAPLAARLESVIEQIDKLTPAVRKGDEIDEVAARRAARKSVASKGQARAETLG